MNNILFVGLRLDHSLLPLVYELIEEEARLKLNVIVAEMEEHQVIKTLKESDFKDIQFICFSFPYKILAASLVQVASPFTAISNSSNIVYKNDHGLLVGDITDGRGFISDLKDRKGLVLKNNEVLILGDGGVARAIIPRLIAEGVKHITICKRKNKRHPNQFMKDHSDLISFCSYDKIPDKVFDLVVNATSASIYHELSPFVIRPNARDAFYAECAYSGLGPTIFEEFLKDNDVTSYTNGLGMLVDQAVIAIWDQFGVQVDREVVYQKLLKKLMLPVK